MPIDLGWLVTGGAVAAVVVLVVSELAVRAQTRAVGVLMTQRERGALLRGVRQGGHAA